MLKMNLQNNKNADQKAIAPTKEPSIQIDQRLKDEALTQVEQQGMVVVWHSPKKLDRNLRLENRV